MASDQARREKVTDERVEEDPEMQPRRGGGGDVDRSREARGKQSEDVARQTPSLEEISKLRAAAQQNSMEAIRAAEERYQKASR